MSTDHNKKTARTFFDAWTNGDLEAFDEVLAADSVDHDAQNPFAGGSGPAVAKQMAGMYRAAFPDTVFTVHEQVAEGDYVATRWSARGTHDGELLGMPATGRSVEITGIQIDRFSGEMIAETWSNWDALGLMQQLQPPPPG